MLERALEERAARFGPLFSAFPSISDARASAGAAVGEPFTARSGRGQRAAARAWSAAATSSGVWEGAHGAARVDRRALALADALGRSRARASSPTGRPSRAACTRSARARSGSRTSSGAWRLLGSQIRTLRQLPPLESATDAASELPALPLVRVRTPGGVFQGRLLRREEGRVRC
jgi:hypothetical protein